LARSFRVDWTRCAAFVALAWVARAQDGSPADGARPNRVDYRIRAELRAPAEDAGSSFQLTGHETVRFENRTAEPAAELWFHAYWNAFANGASTHLRESGGRLRLGAVEDGWGWMRVTSASKVAPGTPTDLLPSLRWRAPDDGNVEDRTVFSLALPEPVAPGGTVSVEIAWESQVPLCMRRTGAKDDFVLMAHWFPKLGVFEGARGWNCHQFHANTEFFSDYGSYEVTLDLPGEYAGRVGGSGVQVLSRPKPDGRVEVAFVAPSSEDQQRLDGVGKRPLVHEFAWTADPDYVVRVDTFRFQHWAEQHRAEVERVERALGEGVDVRLRDVVVTVLVQPEHADQAERYFQATCAALFFYGLWFGEYPYEHVTVVDPAHGAGAGGMEYPTLFTGGTRLFTESEMHQPESVTVHECGHQFWYGLVGNNEFEAAWLDEGFNSYADAEVMSRVYGPSRATTWFGALPVRGVALAARPGGGDWSDALALRRIPLPMLPDPAPLAPSAFLDLWRDQPWLTYAREVSDPRAEDRTRFVRAPVSDPIDTPGWLYVDRESYTVNSYPRTAAALRSLEGLVRGDAFLRGMRHYAATWRYAHPGPDDFFAAFQAGDGLDQDLGWFFDELFGGVGTVDWSVGVEQKPAREPRGYFEDAAGGWALRADDGAVDGAGGADDRGDRDDRRGARDETDDEDHPGPWRIDVVLRRAGTLALPLDVELAFDDGSTERLVWGREEQLAAAWKRILHESSAKKLSSVRLDPDQRYFLDADQSNDQWHAAEDSVAPLRWGERALSQYAQTLFWSMGIGG
jgi:hypothetical protein